MVFRRKPSILLLFLFSFICLSAICLSQAAYGATILNLSYSDVTKTSVKLSWSRSADWLFQYYQVCMKTKRIFGWTDWEIVQTIYDMDTLSYTVTGLTQGTTYQFKVIDDDLLGAADSNIISVTTLSDPLWLQPVFLVTVAILSVSAIGIFFFRGNIIRYINSSRAERRARMYRVCPRCGQTVPINIPICPHCGLDISKSIRCEYCNEFFDRSLDKCPNCGARRKG